MFKSFDSDRPFLERKYHDPDKEFNPFRRMFYHGEGYIEDSGLDDKGIKDGLKEKAEGFKGVAHPIARAEAIKYILENQRLYISEHDYFIGFYSLGRLADPFTLHKWDAEVAELKDSALKTVFSDLNASGAVAIWPDYDHVVPDWESLLKLGFMGIKSRAADYREHFKKCGELTPEKDAFYEAIDIQYSAIIDCIKRAADIASGLDHPKARHIEKYLKNLVVGAPTNIYEAMQLILIYFLVSECIDSYQVRSLGNGLDRSLYPFFINDLKNGTFSKDEIKEFLAYFLMQWSAIGNYWGQPFYLGGTNPDGTTKVNELTRMIVDVYDEIGIYNPKIQIKYNSNIPQDFANKILDMVRRGHSSFVFCCEPGMIKAVMGYGATYEEALDMDIRGCYETGVRANEVSTGTGYINAAKAVEYVFCDGFDLNIGRQVGLKTGDIDSFKAFEDFYGAVLSQWGGLIEKTIAVANDYERFLSYVNPSTMYSATVDTAVRQGKDGYQNGVKFCNSAILNCSFASLVDSVMTVKHFVYDEKTVTLSEMKDAILNDWDGYEKLRLKIKKSPYKYGNGNEEADRYAEAMAKWFAEKVNNRPNARGGVYKAIMHSARQFIEQGAKTLATPDGRRKGEELSKNASPVVGEDKNGVTALISSACRLCPSLYHESFCLDVMLHPSAVSGDEGLCVMKALLDTYMNNGGMSIQFNVFNEKTLREAQKEPQKYKNLQVRVCGWNVLWNNMSREEQESYILRAENIK